MLSTLETYNEMPFYIPSVPENIESSQNRVDLITYYEMPLKKINVLDGVQ